MPNRTVYPRTNQRGFTLVEMAIVLVIIGLILGAVAIGKDAVRNAEYQKVGNKFVYEWKKSYDEAYQRSGVQIGDSQVAPTGMINGNETLIGGLPAASGNLTGALPGLPTSYTNTGLRICHGQGYAKDAVGAGDPDLATQDLRPLIQRIGIRMPPGRGEGKEDRYLYTDTNGNAAEIEVCFQWNPPGTISGAGNVMVVRGLTPDLARFIDQMIDGKPDALEGRFRQQDNRQNTAEPSSQQPGHEWEANNTFANSQVTGPGSQTQTGQNKDEDQVKLLTAHWIMDQ
jgi:prepilin-type N-terminal cleavage/methylation domain-containing protein